jgi:hypothetical protein
MLSALYDRFQYIQDKQEITLNDRFGGNTGHSNEYSGIGPSRSGRLPKPAVPWLPAYFCFAAETDLPILQPVLTLSARTRHSPANCELQECRADTCRSPIPGCLIFAGPATVKTGPD